MNKLETVAILIDVQNLFYSCKLPAYAGQRVSYRKLLEEAVGNRNKHEAKAYCSVHPLKKNDSDAFLKSLSDSGIRVLKKDCSLDQNKNPKKGNLDVEIAADAMSYLYSKFVDVIILISGDGDFAYLGEQAHRLGKKFEVISFKDSISKQLQIVADKVTYIEEKHLFKKVA